MNYNRNQRLKMICAAGDKIADETGVNPSKVTGYAVSMAAFGRKPNGDFYALFEEWLRQRRAVPGAPPVDMPAEAAAELEHWTDHLKAQIMQRVTGIVRDVAGSFEQTTAMRVVALEHLCADQPRRNQEVLATLVDTEAELEAAGARIAALTGEIQQERNRVQRLLGRLEERGVLHVEGPGAADDQGASGKLTDTPRPDRTAAVYALVNGPPDDEEVAADEGKETGTPMTADTTGNAISRADQPSDIPTDDPAGGQSVIPPVTKDAADQAAVGGDDRNWSAAPAPSSP